MKSIALTSLLAGAVLSAVIPAAAVAQSRSMIPQETLEVMLRRQDAMFDRLDLNRDGAVTTVEAEAAAAAIRARMGAGPAGQGAAGTGSPAGGNPSSGVPGSPAGPAGPAGRQGQGGPRGGFMARMFTEADADGDGQLSRAEMRASATRRFQEMDRNGDGVLSEDERPAGFGMRGPGAGQPAAQPFQIPMGEDGG